VKFSRAALAEIAAEAALFVAAEGAFHMHAGMAVDAQTPDSTRRATRRARCKSRVQIEPL